MKLVKTEKFGNTIFKDVRKQVQSYKVFKCKLIQPYERQCSNIYQNCKGLWSRNSTSLLVCVWNVPCSWIMSCIILARAQYRLVSLDTSWVKGIRLDRGPIRGCVVEWKEYLHWNQVDVLEYMPSHNICVNLRKRCVSAWVLQL